MDNTKLIAAIRSGDMEDRSWMIEVLDRAAAALEAAESELTRLRGIIHRQEQTIESYEAHPSAPKRDETSSACYINGCITAHEEGAAHVPEFNPHA